MKIMIPCEKIIISNKTHLSEFKETEKVERNINNEGILGEIMRNKQHMNSDISNMTEMMFYHQKTFRIPLS